MRGLPMALRQFWNRSSSESNRIRVIHAFAALMVLCTFPFAVMGGNALKSVDFSALPGDRVQLTLGLSGTASEPAGFITDNPARISLDFVGVNSELGYKTKLIGVGPVHSVTALEAGNRTRLVINLTHSLGYKTELQGNNVIVTLDVSGKAKQRPPVKGPSSVVSMAPANTQAPSMMASSDIKNIDFRRGEAGEGRVLVTLADPAIPVDVREEAGQIILEFFDASVDASLLQSLDVMDFATPVTKVETRKVGSSVVIEVSPVGEFDYLAYQANETFAVEVRSLTKDEKEALQKERMIFTGERLSLNFQDIEVRSVLQLLADFTELNLVTSDTVDGRITLRLKNVPWDQALDIILKSKGLSKRQIDNVIMVAPTEEIAAREQLELESQQKIEELAPLRSDFVQVNYAKAEELAALLKSDENRLLSERGNVTVDVRTNTLLIQDTASKLGDIRRLLKKLDVPVRQVLIESRVVVANNDFAKDLGVRFGASFGNSFNSGNNGYIVGGSQPGHLGNTLGLFNQPGIEIPAGSTNESLMVNLPVTSPSGGVNFLVGKMGS
ncbi:MAG: secretin and TonB N-terminal domain-containing protein, partial [Candidatus Thiodiazotropha sp. (ex Semelilucina semeliformis)]|nr:secretin and TonB N-terminal domain-containing protein [Candidatus Thiodiazotropha sp. (ex Semelilucina semeliformis)]